MRTRAVLLALATTAATLVAAGPAPAAAPNPMAVVALIDTGINPYHPAFRDTSPLATQHPSTYIPGYPASAEALEITLDVPLEDALAADFDAIWRFLPSNRLFWIPGTRIVGLRTLAAGGKHCPFFGADFFPANFFNGPCPERKGLDDHGHGTMTASRAAAAGRSLGGEDVRIVAIEGLGADSVRWAASQDWIDVQSNSWGELVPHPVSQTDVNPAFGDAAKDQVVVVAAGNGAGGFFGAAPHPTYAFSVAAPGVVVAGAHDNGRVTAWSGAPPHVVADGYGGWAAPHDSLDPIRPDPGACCTSAAAPYVAGGAARLIVEARRLLGAAGTGIVGGIVATGTPPAGATTGPLADGTLTLDELTALLRATAEPRPAEGADDGILHWTGEPRAPDHLGNGPGGNPYCSACQTLPVRWSDVPAGAFAYPMIGYGAINERSVALAVQVMRGDAPAPVRPVEDALYAKDQELRRATAR